MTSIFRKALNLKNVYQFHFLLNPARQRNIAFLKNPSIFTAASIQKNEAQSFPVSQDATGTPMPDIVLELLDFVQKEDADQTVVKLQNMKKGFVRKIPLNEMTRVVDLLIKKKKGFDLSRCVQPMSYIINNTHYVLKPLLEEYSNSGDIGSLNEMVKIIPDFALIKCNFNHYLTKAYIVSEKFEDLMLELEKHFYEKNKVISTSAFDELLKRSEFEERAVNLAKKYYECKHNLPLTIVWAYYLIHTKYEKADELMKTYSVPAEKVDLLVLKAISEQENVKLGHLYISALNQQNARDRCKERAYGTLLDVLVSKGMHDDAVALITHAMENNVNLETHYRSTLIKLMNALEAEKKEMPLDILSKIL